MAVPTITAGTPVLNTDLNLSTALNIPVPTGVTAGDWVMVFIIGSYEWDWWGREGDTTHPTGFTHYGQYENTNAEWCQIFLKKATGTDTGTYNWNWNGFGIPESQVFGGAIRISNAHDTFPIVALDIAQDFDATSKIQVAPAVTTYLDNVKHARKFHLCFTNHANSAADGNTWSVSDNTNAQFYEISVDASVSSDTTASIPAWNFDTTGNGDGQNQSVGITVAFAGQDGWKNDGPVYESKTSTIWNSFFGGGGETDTISKPAGVTEGDLLILHVVADTDGHSTSDWTPPAGFIFGGSTSISVDAIEHWFWYKIAGASEPTSYTMGFDGTFGDYYGATMIRVSGVDTVDPRDNSGAGGNFTDGQDGSDWYSVNAPNAGLLDSPDRCLVLVLHMHGWDDTGLRFNIQSQVGDFNGNYSWGAEYYPSWRAPNEGWKRRFATTDNSLSGLGFTVKPAEVGAGGIFVLQLGAPF